AHDQDAPLGVACVARPHLLAVHHYAVTLDLAAGAKRGQVGARAGFGEALAPHLVAAQDRLEEALLLRLGAVVDQGWAGQVGADGDVDRVRSASREVFLAEQHLLERRESLTAVLLGPGETRPAAVVELALPSPRERHLL